MTALARFQDDFAAALAGSASVAPVGPPSAALAGAPPDPALATSVAALVAQPGFAVYRNTVAGANVDALQANYPTVSRLVGDEWFRAAASLFAASNPPRLPMMVEYGEGFADFLAGFEPARELHYLAGVARLDRFWTLAHVAADAVALAGARIAALAPDALGRTRLRVHPAARWALFDEAPVGAIWRRHRDAAPDAAVDLDDLEWRGDGVLVTRPDDGVQWVAIDAATVAFLDACACGETVVQAAAAALEAQPDADLAETMKRLLDAGAFAEPDPTSNDEEQM